jgi:hypothetical protein
MRALYEEAGLTLLLSEWGSIELEPLMRRLPKRLRRRGLWQRLSTALLLLNETARFPLQASFDTIAVGRRD